jgi:hypothetical protein
MLVAVTGSDAPYLYDLPQLQALPAGFEFRFRYKRTWVESKLLKRLEANPKALDERELLLVFHSRPRKSLIPLRYATIRGVELIGPIVFVRFELGPFFLITEDMVRAATEDTELSPTADSRGVSIDRILKLADNESELLGLLGLLTKNLRTALNLSSNLGDALPNGKYLCDADECPWAQRSEAKSTLECSVDWARIAALLHKEVLLAGIPMFYLLGFQDAHSWKWSEAKKIPRFRVWMDGRVPGYRIWEGSRATLRVLLWREKLTPDQPLIAYRANPVTNAELVRLEGAANLVIGKYDVLQFTFEARRPGVGELGLRVDPEVPGTSPWPEVLTARVPLQVVHNLWKVAGFLVAACAGLGCILGAGLLVQLFHITSADAPFGIRAVGLLVLSLAIGSYLDRFAKLTADFQKFTGVQVTRAARGE